MLNQRQNVSTKGRRFIAAVFFVFAVAGILFSGCVANDENSMPWAAPEPGDGSIQLPGSFTRQ